MESDTPIGFLQGAGGISSEIQDILQAAGHARADNPVYFSEDPDELLRDLTKFLDTDRARYHTLYQ
jgi:hypothetical protein